MNKAKISAIGLLVVLLSMCIATGVSAGFVPTQTTTKATTATVKTTATKAPTIVQYDGHFRYYMPVLSKGRVELSRVHYTETVKIVRPAGYQVQNVNARYYGTDIGLSKV
jgi:hypothetical protein